MSTSIIAFVIVLGVLIFFHELGHFLVARFFGVGVEKFSLGFGPRIFGRTVGITDYRISAIPLGGYVKMIGEDPDADIDPAEMALSFTHKHVFKRIMIVAAGPFFNLLLAVIIFFGLFMVSGTFILKSTVGEIKEGAPAWEAGVQKGDRIYSIDGVAISTWDEMAERIKNSGGQPLLCRIYRGESEIELTITPQLQTAKNIFGEDTPRYVIGVTSAGDVIPKRLNPFEALGESLRQTWDITRLTVLSIVKLIQGSISSKTLGGPIMIAQMAGDQAREGAANLLFFTALISINLGILNFLPIPVLDGGHLLFFTIEAITRRPVSTKVREIAQQIGMFILLLLMVYVFYNDISRIFFS
jgi:regulator of sigma E protease